MTGSTPDCYACNEDKDTSRYVVESDWYGLSNVWWCGSCYNEVGPV